VSQGGIVATADETEMGMIVAEEILGSAKARGNSKTQSATLKTQNFIGVFIKELLRASFL